MLVEPKLFMLAIDYDAGYIETRFFDRSICRGSHVGNDEESYLATARRIGYGDNVRLMAIENDALHSFVCLRAGLPFSPALWGTAHRRWWPGWEQEEACAFTLQWLLHGGNPDQWHLEQLAHYLRWARPKTTIDELVAQARAWLDDLRSKPLSA